MGYEEDLGEMSLLGPERLQKIVPPAFILAPEDLIKDQERGVVHLVHLGKEP